MNVFILGMNTVVMYTRLFFFADDPCGNKPCGKNQTCVVTDTGFVCECMMGYQGDCNKCEGKC